MGIALPHIGAYLLAKGAENRIEAVRSAEAASELLASERVRDLI